MGMWMDRWGVEGGWVGMPATMHPCVDAWLLFNAEIGCGLGTLKVKGLVTSQRNYERRGLKHPRLFHLFQTGPAVVFCAFR